MDDDQRRAAWARLYPWGKPDTDATRVLAATDPPPPIVPTAEYCARLEDMARHYDLRRLLDGLWGVPR